MPIKRYNGSGQVSQTARRWNGSAWVKQLVKRWNGSAWVTVSATLHTWQKWSVKTEITVLSYTLVYYSETQSGIGDDDQTTVATDYTFDTSTGWITLTGSANLWENGGGYSESGGDLEVINVVVGSNPRAGTAYTTIYSVEPDQTSSEQVKDAYLGTVTSYNPSAYPENGIQGGYWYVKV